MSRIDSHQHFWHYSSDTHSWISEDERAIRRDFLPNDLKPELDRHHIDGCVAVQASQSEQETKFLLDLAARYDFIFGVVGWVDLRSEHLEDRLVYYDQFPKLVGMRHIVQDEPDLNFLLRPEFVRGVRLLSAYHLTYDILIYENQLPIAAKFAAKLPETRLVLDHLAKPKIAKQERSAWQANIRSLAALPQVYCKLSGMVTEADWTHWQPDDLTPYLDTVVEAFGVDRLMYGSDWPVCLLAASYHKVIESIDQYFRSFSSEEREKIYGKNAINFYQLKS